MLWKRKRARSSKEVYKRMPIKGREMSLEGRGDKTSNSVAKNRENCLSTQTQTRTKL